MKVFNEVQVVESLHLAAKREKIREGTGTLYRVPVPNGQYIVLKKQRSGLGLAMLNI